MDKKLPEGMHRRGRPIDPLFESSEELYLRFRTVLNDKPNVSEIRCPNQSVNRAKYSEAEWVLLPSFLDFGYGAFKVKDVPEKIERPEGNPYRFKVEHDPIDENYSHCELRAYVNNIRQNTIQNKQVKLTFRMRISQKTTIIGYPKK